MVRAILHASIIYVWTILITFCQMPRVRLPDEDEDLCRAVLLGDLTHVETFLAEAHSPNYPADKKSSLLHIACMSDSVDMARLLLDAKALVNARDHCDLTPLMLAAIDVCY